MSLSFRCGHPKTLENSYKVGNGRVICRECKLASKRRWRERARAIAQGKRVAIRRGPKPAIPANTEFLSPEAFGSRRLLEAYARYYERHVRR